MNAARRTLNVLAALFIVFAGIGLAMFIVQAPGKKAMPFSFVAAFALLPALAHLVAAVWAWPSVGATVASRERGVWGLAFSSIAFFTWLVIASVLVELALREPPMILDWPRVTLALGLLVLLPVSAGVNFMFFRRALVPAARQHEA